jgi:hypothetical protein
MLARVVDFPDPVGPVTKIKPLLIRVREETTGGRFKLFKSRRDYSVYHQKTYPKNKKS